MGYPLYFAGNNDEAIRAFRSALDLDSQFFWSHLWIGQVKVRQRQYYVSAYYLALIYAGLGMRDRTFEHLDKAIEERQPYLILLNVEPPFLSLHSDIRFQDVLRRIGIPTTP